MRESSAIQPMLATGSLNLAIGPDTIETPFAACDAEAADFETFASAPASFRGTQQEAKLVCVFETPELRLQINMRSDYLLTVTEAAVQLPGTTLLGTDPGTATTYSGSRYATDLELVPAIGEGVVPTGGRVQATASVAPSFHEGWTEELPGATLGFSVQNYSVSGSATLTLDDGSVRTFPIDDTACWAQEVTIRLLDAPTGT